MIRVALAQIDPVVGDIRGNSQLILRAVMEARDRGAQVVVLPELAICGYPPEDLVLKRSFVAANAEAARAVAEQVPDILTVFGFVDEAQGRLYNAAAICSTGNMQAIYRKQLLPNYGVFDERRYFHPGVEHILIETPQGVIGVCVCEDAWEHSGPVVAQGDAGAQIILNINASPFHENKISERAAMLGERALRAGAAIVYVNMVGGQDEVVFDGGSLVVGPGGELVAQLPQFKEILGVVDVPLGVARSTPAANVRRVAITLPGASGTTDSFPFGDMPDEPEVYGALCLGLRDYALKNGFTKAVIGLSGGIDSSLVAAIAADALGPAAVLGIAMPSPFSSDHSVSDAYALAEALGIEIRKVPIATIFDDYGATLKELFAGTAPGIAEENLQARIRGNLLMAISNKFGHLVIATGNKSEMACGYATLYGDMAGGFALLKDVFKTEVYALSRYRNELSPVIPISVLEKPPSAELRPDQKDSDSLPAYDVLDPILEAYIERDEGFDTIVAAGHDPAIVARVITMVDRAEYKRRQAPPGPKVSVKAFGRDRRLPITNRWREGGA